jgi:hypothetical protein
MTTTRQRQRQRQLLDALRHDFEREQQLRDEGRIEEAEQIRFSSMGLQYEPPKPSLAEQAAGLIREGRFKDAFELTGPVAEVVGELSASWGEKLEPVDGQDPRKILMEITERLCADLGDREGDTLLKEYTNYSAQEQQKKNKRGD